MYLICIDPIKLPLEASETLIMYLNRCHFQIIESIIYELLYYRYLKQAATVTKSKIYLKQIS